MIEINLLPEELRKEKKFQLNLDLQASKVRIIGGSAIAGILIFLVLFFSIGASIRKGQAARLLDREQGISQDKVNAETLNQDIAVLRSKMAVLGEVTKRRFLWAEKLNQLSDLVLPGIWYTRIYTGTDGMLIIEGSVISKKEEAMASVGKFMKGLGENNDFFSDFSNIKLETVQRKSLEERDVVDFKVVLYLK